MVRSVLNPVLNRWGIHGRKAGEATLERFRRLATQFCSMARVVQIATNYAIHEKIEVFIYFYMTFQENSRYMPHVRQVGDSVTTNDIRSAALNQ